MFLKKPFPHTSQKKPLLKTYLEKSRYPKWPPFGENFGEKHYSLYIMYVKA